MAIRTGKDAERYRRWHDHPLREILREAAQGGHIHKSTLDRLELPSRVKSATKEAIKAVKRADHPNHAQVEADRISHELVDALYAADPHWETPDARRERLASEGDADALASIKAEREARDQMVDRVLEP